MEKYNNNNTDSLINPVQKKIQYLTYDIGGLITLIILLIILYLQIKKKEKGIISRSLILITISEIFNCIQKIINRFKENWELYANIRPEETSIICYIQFLIGNYVDIFTPLMSLIISREINYLVDMNELSSLGNNQVLAFSIGFIFCCVLILFLIQILFLNKNKIYIKNSDYVCYGSIYTLHILLPIIIILIVISLNYSLKSLSILKQTTKNYEEIEEGLMSNDESLDDIPNTPDDKVSTKLNKMYRKNLRYPLFISIFWVLFILVRYFDIIFFIKIRDENDIMKTFYCVISCITTVRGLLYSYVFFSRNDLCNKNAKKNIQNLSQIDEENVENRNSRNIFSDDDEVPYQEKNEKIDEIKRL